tara:strand:+ start:864 stop:1901 length:1038 start_codon:yes stop_codon:yes gene_type:complete
MLRAPERGLFCMDKELEKKLNTLYTEILNGFSIRKTTEFGQFYIKHFDLYDAGEMNFEREQYLQQAISRGLPTEKENLETAIKEGFWDKDTENSIYDLEKTIVNMRATKNKLQLRSQKINFQKKIDKKEKALNELLFDRYEVIGYTAETFANKKANEYYIYKALKKDSTLKDEFFSEEEYDEMHDSDLQELMTVYGAFTEDFSHKNLKRIALTHSFLNLYHLCSDRVSELFGVPVVKLTFFQSEIFGTSKYFKSILNDAKHKPTEEMYGEPDLLLDWMESNSGGKVDIEGKMEEKAGVSYVGATKEDLKDLGVDENNTISFSKEAAKKGGSLDMKDIMKMHGYQV